MLARLCSKSFMVGFNSTYTKNFQMYKMDLEKADKPEIKLPMTPGSRGFKNTSASLTTLKPLTVWITTNCGKFLKRWEYQTTLPISWETCMQVKKQQLELDMEQWTVSKLGKDDDKALYWHPAYLLIMYMQSTWWKMLVWMNHKLESRWLGEISTSSDMQTILL